MNKNARKMREKGGGEVSDLLKKEGGLLKRGVKPVPNYELIIKQVLRSSGSRRDKKLLSVSLENNTIRPFQQLCHLLVRQILGFDKSQNC